MITRRDVIKAGTLAAAAAALPSLPVNAAAAVEALPAWGVGIEEEGHTVQFARTLHDAVMSHVDEAGVDVCDACAAGRTSQCENIGRDDYWCRYSAVTADREPTLDKFHAEPDKVDNVALRAIGWSVPCAWCDYARAYRHFDEHPSAYDTDVIDGQVVCHECIEFAKRDAQRA